MTKLLGPHTTGKRSLKKLIQLKEWDDVIETLENASIGKAFCREKFEGGLTCLSLAVCQNAPISVIESMIKLHPSLISNTDVFGLNVLHLGCLNGASLHIIQYLIRHHQFLTREIDVDGRSPLHHAVEYAIYCALEGQDVYFHYIEVLEDLCSLAPDLTIIQDNTGITSIDMVQDVKVRMDIQSAEYDRLEIIYDVLKKTSIQHYKTQRNAWILERLKEEAKSKKEKIVVDMPLLDQLQINQDLEVCATCSLTSY